MGRRKIDIAYITDDRVRKVTFCKRKGGLFKKAEDLSKLCGVEIAVVIIGDKKTSEFASTDMNRILERYKDMQTGVPGPDNSETSRLWEQLEQQRRELEALTRELSAERHKVEELRMRSTTAHTVLQPMEVAENNVVLAANSLPQVCAVASAAIMRTQESTETPADPDASTLIPIVPVLVPAQPSAKPEADGNASDDTAEVEDSGDDDDVEPEVSACKRQKVTDTKEEVLSDLPTVQVPESERNAAAAAAEG